MSPRRMLTLDSFLIWDGLLEWFAVRDAAEKVVEGVLANLRFPPALMRLS